MSDRVVFTDPPDEEQRIEVLFAWVAVHANGAEGIISVDLPMSVPGETMRHMPLFSSKRAVAKRMQPLAREIQRAAMHQVDRIVRIELREFRRVIP